MNSVTNVTQFVRNVLYEIGAIKDQPPKGWKKIVEEKISEQGVDVSKVNIYAIRNKELAKKGTDGNSVSDLANCTHILIELRSFATKVGGIDRLQQLIDVLKNCQC